MYVQSHSSVLASSLREPSVQNHLVQQRLPYAYCSGFGVLFLLSPTFPTLFKQNDSKNLPFSIPGHSIRMSE